MTEETKELTPSSNGGNVAAALAVQMPTPIEAIVFDLVHQTNQVRLTDTSNENDMSEWVELDKKLQTAASKINDNHKAMTAGILESKRMIDQRKKVFSDTITAARNHIQERLIKPLRTRMREEAERLAAEEKARLEQSALDNAAQLESEGKSAEADQVLADGEALAGSVGVTQRVGPIRGETAGTASFTKQAMFEIEDPGTVPREYCIPDEKKIREAVRRKENPVREIPGVRIWMDEKMRNA